MIITVMNQKGGVGKTTVATNLGYGLSLKKKNTLVVDTDPQANTSSIFFDGENEGVSRTINDLFLDKNADISGAIYPARLDGREVKKLSILPAGKMLDEVEQRITTRMNRHKFLSGHLRKVGKEYDYVIIDCRPTLGPLTENAIFSADLILIPTSCSKFSLDGIADLFEKIGEVKEGREYRYRILKNLYDLRATQSNAVIDSALDEFKGNLFSTVIRRSEPINQAQMNEETVFTFAPSSNGAQDFKKLVKEIMNHG